MKSLHIMITVCVSALALTMTACGQIPTKADAETKSGGEQSANGGSASLQIADLSSLGDVKKLKLTVSSTDSQAGSYSFTQTDDYASGKSLVVANLPSRTYSVTLEAIDGAGKVLATGVASNVQIKAGEATNLSISLSKAGQGGTLVVTVKPPVAEPPAAPTLKTVQSLLNTHWYQSKRDGGFSISATYVTYSKWNPGCLGESHLSLIFTADGKIVKNTVDDYPAIVNCACRLRSQPTYPPLTSYPELNWKTYELRDGQLIITTDTGETHSFSKG